jgi:pSer/pThr/pTyr-binding forkhead associated (FHA) protein
MFRLEVKFQNLTMKEYIPQEARTLTIGRQGENDIVLRDSSVSRHHASFMKEGENLFVTDKGSKNGTIVNGLKVESARLEDGDVIRIGDNLVIVVSVTSDIETSATVTGEHVQRATVPDSSV